MIYFVCVKLQIEAWDAAIKSCDFVLRVQPDNVKALFRKAKVAAVLFTISFTYYTLNTGIMSASPFRWASGCGILVLFSQISIIT